MLLSEALWQAILELKSRQKKTKEDLFPVSLVPGSRSRILTGDYQDPGQMHILITKDPDFPPGADRLVFLQYGDLRLELQENSLEKQHIPEWIWMYLQVCLADLHAEYKGRSVSFAHFAQSLDGRIATPTGKSRWISCRENLLHAHRMRALCDGILIGANTLLRDKPSLNVRHVPGPDPVKVILGNPEMDYSSLKKDYGRILVLSSEQLQEEEGVEFIHIQGNKRIMDPEMILKKLYDKGLRSVFIEGGAYTTSAFMARGQVDVLQVYSAPKILGSGVSSFTLPLIDEVDESVLFTKYEFVPMGDGMLFCGINMHAS